MNKLLVFLSALLVITACSNNENEMVLTGHVKGLKKGTILLQKVEDSVLVSVDSVRVDGDANFRFKEVIESPEIYYIYLRLKDGTLMDDRIPFFAEANEINITTTLKSFSLKATVTGSENENLYQNYVSQIKRYSDKNLDLIEQRFKAQQEGNDSIITALEQQQTSLKKSRYLATVNFAKNHKEFEIAPYLMLTQLGSFKSAFADSVYNSLPKRIKDSKYGKELALELKNK
ncbi:DUF4369 domain-containing protein [Cochleicola gelatinilyticus]|uniref:DUF4369 domain-containing protein n=1 Tax=Cochleicola gelatinilyticus TaxID=1763537 RepID=A0A167KAD3_9FLAO|nr:DUF4369 domain-containing protein [Cochleicola gelatinilyticus]OAB81560.1 hypothetical protein ULVI_01700 [Cochleicola gelatinilyticus]